MSAPRPVPLVLFACVTKGSRWDWTVEKATELGATKIVPVLSDRTIVRIPPAEREAKRARWTRVAEDAARQSDAKWLPEVAAPVDFAESLPLVRETTCFVGALTNPPSRPILEALGALWDSRQMMADGRVPSDGQSNNQFAARGSCFVVRDGVVPAIFVGPEGDFTPDELSALCEIATPVTFGSTILRAETAAIYGLSAVKSFLDVHAR